MADAAEFKTWCMGRHLFDVPVNLEPVENYSVVDTMVVDRVGEGGDRELDIYLNDRITALRNGLDQEDGTRVFYRMDTRLGDVRIVAHEIDTSLLGVPAEDWSEEAYVTRDGVLFRVSRAMFPEDADAARGTLVAFARSLKPRDDATAPQSGNLCLPGAEARLAPTTEAHGVTFAPGDETGPVGLRIETVFRPADAPPLEVSEAMPGGPGSQDVVLAGLEGRLLEANDPDIGRLLVAGHVNEGGRDGVRVILEYYDERAEAGTEPYDTDWVDAVWARLRESFATIRTTP